MISLFSILFFFFIFRRYDIIWLLISWSLQCLFLLLLFEEKDFYGALFLRFPFCINGTLFFFFWNRQFIEVSLYIKSWRRKTIWHPYSGWFLVPPVLVPDWQAISCIDFHFFLFFLLKDNIRQKPDIFIIKLYINFRMFVGKW